MYNLTSGDCILRTSDNAWIPPDPENIDYQEYLSWVDLGNSPQPYVAPPAPTEPTPIEKLAASGLTVAELKALLGL